MELTGKRRATPDGHFVIVQRLGETLVLLQQQTTETGKK